MINKIYKLKLRRITREQCRRVFDIKLKHSFRLFSTRFKQKYACDPTVIPLIREFNRYVST